MTATMTTPAATTMMTMTMTTAGAAGADLTTASRGRRRPQHTTFDRRSACFHAVLTGLVPTMGADLDDFPGNSDVFVVSLADIDGLERLGELLMGGFVYTEGGVGPDTVTLETIVPGGAIPSYDPLAAAIAIGRSGTGVSGAVSAQVEHGLADRFDDADLTTPFDFLTGLTQTQRTFSFSDPSAAASPAANLVRGGFFVEDRNTGDREFFLAGRRARGLDADDAAGSPERCHLTVPCADGRRTYEFRGQRFRTHLRRSVQL
ncbi:MAG: hypothetical protein M5R36_02665 [Deltaproteobacteria bacterium]|nr:hypothetical protein [Deltaproteobacteria bacterium]